MRVAWLLLADGMAQRPDGKTDLYGAGMDVIWAANTPAIHPRLTLGGRALMTAAEADVDHQLEVVIRAPDGQVIASANGRIQPVPEEARQLVPGALPGIGIHVDFVNLGLPTFGRYVVELAIDEEPIADPPSFVVVRMSSQASPT